MFLTVMLHQVIHGDGTGATGVRLGLFEILETGVRQEGGTW